VGGTHGTVGTGLDVTSPGRAAEQTHGPARRSRTLDGPRWRTWVLGAGVALALLALVGTFVQPIRVRLVAAATTAEALDLPVLRPFAASYEVERRSVAGVDGVLYEVGPSAPAVVLVPGAVPGGTDDRRIVRLAEAVAGAGRTVFVPELQVYDEELELADVERIVRVTQALAGPERGPAAIVGISFGGSLGLLAAADDRLQDGLALVATFGAYMDLVGVLQAATTGTALVAGERISWEADPRAEQVVREQLVAQLPDERRAEVEAALDGAQRPGELDSGSRAVYELLTNEDPAATFALAESLPAELRDRLAAVSPVTVAHRIDAPVIAMHSTEDPAIPYAELLRLGRSVDHAQLVTLQRFDHVGLELDSPRSWGTAMNDLRQVWRFTTTVLDSPTSDARAHLPHPDGVLAKPSPTSIGAPPASTAWWRSATR
jgi:pimeloyl-ACP methyl ester carboxylesterase